MVAGVATCACLRRKGRHKDRVQSAHAPPIIVDPVQTLPWELATTPTAEEVAGYAAVGVGGGGLYGHHVELCGRLSRVPLDWDFAVGELWAEEEEEQQQKEIGGGGR